MNASSQQELSGASAATNTPAQASPATGADEHDSAARQHRASSLRSLSGGRYMGETIYQRAAPCANAQGPADYSRGAQFVSDPRAGVRITCCHRAVGHCPRCSPPEKRQNNSAARAAERRATA